MEEEEALERSSMDHSPRQYGYGDVGCLERNPDPDQNIYINRSTNRREGRMGNKNSRKDLLGYDTDDDITDSEEGEVVSRGNPTQDKEKEKEKESMGGAVTTTLQYANNLRLFETVRQGGEGETDVDTLSSLRQGVKLRRSISLRKQKEKSPVCLSPTATLISEILELSKTFRIHRSPLQKSVSAMSLRIVNMEEADIKDGHLRNFSASDIEQDGSDNTDYKKLIERNNGAMNGHHSSDCTCSGGSSGTEYDTYKSNDGNAEIYRSSDDTDEDVREEVSLNEIDIKVDIKIGNRANNSSVQSDSSDDSNRNCSSDSDTPRNESRSSLLVDSNDTDCDRRWSSEPPEIILTTQATCPSDEDSSPSDDSCQFDDTCPSDSDSCPSDSDVINETDNFADSQIRKLTPFVGCARRGRMSVVTPPSISKLEINHTKRKSKSCGDITEISEDFIEYVKRIRADKPGGLPEGFERLEELTKQAKEDDAPGKLKRSSSQTITEREIKTVEETKSIWDVPSMAKKSKIALAILFIGGRLGSIVQNNLHHVTQIASEDKLSAPISALPVIKGHSLPNVGSQPKKSGVGRSFSFSMRNKSGLLSNKKLTRPMILRSTPKEDYDQGSDNDDDLHTPLPRKRLDSSISNIETGDPLSGLRSSKRCMSLNNLTSPTEDKDLRKIAESAPKRFNSSERLLSPDGVIQQFHQSCENLTPRGRSDMEVDEHRKSSFSIDGKNDSSNEYSSDSEEREARTRLSRSRSISMVTRNMIGFNKSKSVLKKKRCPPHHFVSMTNKHGLECETCRSETEEAAYVRCTHCEYLVHKTCSMQTLETSPTPREKKPHRKLNWSSSKTVALLNKRPSNSEMRDIAPQNGTTKRLNSRDSDQSLHRRVSVTDNNLFHLRPSSPVDSDDDYFSDDSDSGCWRGSVHSDVILNKDDEERLHGIFELINTEKNHIRDLKILIRVFKYKLQEKRHINAEECEQLFPALDELLESCSTLYTQLKDHMEEEIDSPHSNHMIGNILINNFSSDSDPGRCIRGAYARLTAKKIIAVKYYRDKCKDKAFKTLMDALESKKLCKRRTYADFLLAVTTRLTKYPPLLKNLYKHTPENHPDYHSLKEAISVVDDALHYIDNIMLVSNQRAELELCQTKFEVKGRCSRELKHFDLCSNKRRLIHRDHVTLIKAGSKDTKTMLFLYNDYILLLKEKDNKLILNFDDTQCPAIKVKGCLVKNDSSEKLGFLLISNSGRRPESPQHSITNSKIRPTLYRLFANTADEKETWIKLIMETVASGEDEENADHAAANGLSSDERYDSEESDIDISVTERDTCVSFDSDNVDTLADPINTPDSSRNLTLDDIEEQNDDYLAEPAMDYDEEEIERVVAFLRNLGPRSRKQTSFNRPLPRQSSKTHGAAARRAISLHLAERQKRVEENRRHTTCLSKEELNEAMSHTNQTLPSNQTLQDNPVRQKSSDSGYAAEDYHHQGNPNPVLMKMRDCILWVVQDAKKKEEFVQKQTATIEELKRENAELKSTVQKQSLSISRLEEDLKAVKTHLTDQSLFSGSHRTPRSKRTFNSITEEKSENPQTRV